MNATTKKILSFAAPPIIVIGLLLSSVYLWGFGMIEAITVGVLLTVAAFIIRDGFFLREDYLKGWTKKHGVAITDENREVVHRYLRRGRRFRAAGGLVGYATYVIVGVAVGQDKAGVGGLRAVFGGYLLGAAIAELWAFRPQPGAPRAAALAPRRINDYITPVATILMRSVSLATVALVAVWQLIPKGHPAFRGDNLGTRPDLGEALAWGGIAILLVIIVEVTTRRIVHRPQPAVSEGLVEADDAIRSTGMHAVVGAGLALQFGILSRLAGQWTTFTSGGSFHSLLGLASLICGIAAVFSWLHLGIDQKWVVRRTQRRQEVAA